MIKKLFLAVATLIATMSFALAQVDVNKADKATLDGVKGIGPKMSKTIVDERKKGDFKDWADFETRVKGIGDKSSVKLSQAGLTVNGQPKAGAPAMPATKPAKAADGDKKPAMATSAKPADMKVVTPVTAPAAPAAPAAVVVPVKK